MPQQFQAFHALSVNGVAAGRRNVRVAGIRIISIISIPGISRPEYGG